MCKRRFLNIDILGPTCQFSLGQERGLCPLFTMDFRYDFRNIIIIIIIIHYFFLRQGGLVRPKKTK